jgi:hypothetical protein
VRILTQTKNIYTEKYESLSDVKLDVTKQKSILYYTIHTLQLEVINAIWS